MSLTERDRTHLERAAELGRGGWGRVHPNPMVGCVLVRDGRVLAEARHEVFGGPHAEVLALERAGDASGSTAYVSLEPCRHHGKTPPCTEALVLAGVRRVVYGAADPTAQARGGSEELRAAGIDVEGPVFTPERARRENPAFHHAATRGEPWLALKLAVSLDGRISAAPGVRSRLTGPEADREVHRLRAGFDAILVGGRTARVDDPLLTVRADVPVRSAPARLVVDSEGRLPVGAALFRDIRSAPLRLFVGDGADPDRLGQLEAAGAHVHPVPADPAGSGLDLRAVLATCWEQGIRSILCEGGATLAGSLVSAGLARRIYLFVAPRIVGDRGVPAFSGSLREGVGGWIPAALPTTFGNDHLLVFDREPGSGGGEGRSMAEGA